MEVHFWGDVFCVSRIADEFSDADAEALATMGWKPHSARNHELSPKYISTQNMETEDDDRSKSLEEEMLK